MYLHDTVPWCTPHACTIAEGFRNLASVWMCPPLLAPYQKAGILPTGHLRTPLDAPLSVIGVGAQNST